MPTVDTIRYMHRELNVRELAILKKINGDENEEIIIDFGEFKNYMKLSEYAQKRADKYMSRYNPQQPLAITKKILYNNIKKEKDKNFENQEFAFNYAWEVVTTYLLSGDNEHYCNSIGSETYTLTYSSLIDFFCIFKYLKKYANKQIKAKQQTIQDQDILVFNESKEI